MKQNDYEIARELKKRVSEIASIVDFRIFGSRAREDADEYSDMDAFIEVEHLSKKLENKIYHIAWKTGLEHLVLISPLIFTRYEIEKSPLRVSPIVINIMEEGMVI